MALIFFRWLVLWKTDAQNSQCGLVRPNQQHPYTPQPLTRLNCICMGKTEFSFPGNSSYSFKVIYIVVLQLRWPDDSDHSNTSIIAAFPLLSSKQLHDFPCRKLTKFTFIIHKLISYNCGLYNLSVKVTHKYAFYGEMPCLAINR